MSYTIVADVCEGLHDCIPSCPADCISKGHGTNAKGTSFSVIDPAACTNCGICLSICPIEGAVLAARRPESAAPVDLSATLARARQLEGDGDTAAAMAAYEDVIAAADDQWSAEAAYRLGGLIKESGDADGAISVYRRALEFADSRYRQMCALDAGVLLQKAAGELAGAAEMYREAMDSRHSDFSAMAACNLGIVLGAPRRRQRCRVGVSGGDRLRASATVAEGGPQPWPTAAGARRRRGRDHRLPGGVAIRRGRVLGRSGISSR